MGDLFGVAVSPYDLDAWQKATGITPDLCMIFECWSKQRTLTDHLNKAKTFGHTAIAITWEPWTPTPVGTPATEQGAIQPEWSHESILAGRHDEYIDNFARCLRDSKMDVYLRYAHEMNGVWYPWCHNPDKYIEAWKYIRHRVRTLRGAWNVQFIWAPNPDLWRATPADWLRRLLPYWPGGAAMEAIGFTMIDFGGERIYPVSAFDLRFGLARQICHKVTLAMEVNVARENAIEWLNDLADHVSRGDHPLPMVILSQGPSRGAAAGDTGDMGWNPVEDPEGREAIKRLIAAMHRS